MSGPGGSLVAAVVPCPSRAVISFLQGPPRGVEQGNGGPLRGILPSTAAK